MKFGLVLQQRKLIRTLFLMKKNLRHCPFKSWNSPLIEFHRTVYLFQMTLQKLKFTLHWISQNNLYKWNVVWNSQGAAITIKLDSTIESNFLPYWKLSATSGNYKPLWNTEHHKGPFCENLIQYLLNSNQFKLHSWIDLLLK